ncbi:helix-turn-helix domain-containing protein [uncultured Megasphaera sp.]|nr:helix-turn-helix domain-containing protein [uncultured Megasphaera sp.]
MPALRERTSDIPLLANIFLVKMNQRYKTKKSFAPDVLRYLAQLPWIGNVRQLRNIVERVVLMTEGYTITLNQIRQVTADDITESVNDEEGQNQIERLLQEGKNYSEIARILGVSRSTLWRMRKRSN